MALDVVILGPPGAGKGTQAKRIASEAGLPHVATGDMIRAAIAAGDDLGSRVKAIYDRGDLCPDDLMVEVIRARLAREDTVGGFVLDGFPRTLAQSEALDRILEELDRGALSVVLHFQIDEEIAVQRLVGRALEEGRTDDTPDVVRHRLEVYHASTEPVIGYYRAKGILVGIDAAGSVDAVFAEVQEVLQAAEAR
jgi:adenylate kinase